MKRLKYFIVIILISYLFLECENEKENISEFTVVKEESRGKILLDSLRELNNVPIVYNNNFYPNFKSNYKSDANPIQVDSMQSPYYKFLFYGNENRWFEFPSKELTYNHNLNEINSDFVHGKIGFSDFENIQNPMLKIIVDTTQIIDKGRLYYGEIKGDSYPVFIINNSNLWHIANTDPEFPILMQAKDRNGDWNHIEYKINDQICPGLFYFMEPNSYYVTSANKYEGNFKTKFRLKFKRKGKFVYSNEFSGSMNESQFAIPHLPKTNSHGKKNYSIFLD